MENSCLERFFLLEDYIDKINFIYNFLRENESIIFIVNSYLAQTYFERIFLGIDYILLLRKCILVFTNKRILIFSINSNYEFKNVVQEINYEDLKELRLKKNKIVIRFLNGKKEFFRIRRKLAKNIKKFLDQITIEKGNVTQEGNRHYLCPNCGTRLKKGYYRCSNCALEFLNKKKIILYSLFLPGYPELIESIFLGKLGFFISIIVEIAYILIFGQDIYYLLKTGLNFNNLDDFFKKIFLILLIPISGFINANLLFDFIPKKKN